MKATWLAVVMAAALVAPAVGGAGGRRPRGGEEGGGRRRAVAEAEREASPAQARGARGRAGRGASHTAGGRPAAAARLARAASRAGCACASSRRAASTGGCRVNLPLVVVRAFGDDWPIHGCRRCGNGRGPTIGEVLRALDSGESLVEIDDEDATVRVWVD